MMDDKLAVIASATLIALAVIFKGQISSEVMQIVIPVISGLFGLAVGRTFK